MTTAAQWFGGPFDGSYEHLEDGAEYFAIAWDANRRRVFGITDLQAYCTVPGYHSKQIEHTFVTAIHIYHVVRTKTGGAWLYYRECSYCPSDTPTEQ